LQKRCEIIAPALSAEGGKLTFMLDTPVRGIEKEAASP